MKNFFSDKFPAHIFALLFVLNSGYSVHAQTSVSVQAGMNIPAYDYAGAFIGIYPLIYTIETRPGLFFSGTFEKVLSKPFSFRLGLEYSESYTLIPIKEVSLHYVEFPILLQIEQEVFSTPLKYFLNIGIGVRYLALQKIHFWEYSTNFFDFGLQGGVGIQHQINDITSFFVETRYYEGLRDCLKTHFLAKRRRSSRIIAISTNA
jgi:hypothetical protein